MHARTLHNLVEVMTDLLFATYGELGLLARAWKMHGSLSYISVNMLIELASNPARHTGDKLAIGRHLDTCACPILVTKSGT